MCFLIGLFAFPWEKSRGRKDLLRNKYIYMGKIIRRMKALRNFIKYLTEHYTTNSVLLLTPNQEMSIKWLLSLCILTVLSPRQPRLCLSHRTHLANTGIPVIVLHRYLYINNFETDEFY